MTTRLIPFLRNVARLSLSNRSRAHFFSEFFKKIGIPEKFQPLSVLILIAGKKNVTDD
jgi:hypothetical protein